MEWSDEAIVLTARRHGESAAIVTLLTREHGRHAGLVLGGCGSESVDLAGRSFTSTEVRGHDLVEGSKVALSFEDGRISANAGCNTMNGAATWDGDTLQVAGPLAMTMMACDEALMDQDQWLSEFLTSSPALAVDAETLTLGDDTTGITLSEN